MQLFGQFRHLKQSIDQATACSPPAVFQGWGIALLLLCVFSGQLSGQENATSPKHVAKKIVDDSPPVPTGMIVDYDGPAQELLGGKSQQKWDKVDFAGGGDFKIESGVLTIERGEMLSGIYWDGVQLPRQNYEVTLEARRTRGLDIFCGLAFDASADFETAVIPPTRSP